MKALTQADLKVLARRFKTDADRKQTSAQHKKPCADCPWSRKSLQGWLGSHDANTWIVMAHGEHFIDCHLTKNRQCAGAAIYRANVFKSCRNSLLLELDADRALVFSTPAEFKAHHAGKPQPEDLKGS